LEAVYSSCRSNGEVSLILVFLLLLDVALCSNYLHVYSMYALLVRCVLVTGDVECIADRMPTADADNFSLLLLLPLLPARCRTS